MTVRKETLNFELRVKVEEREGYFAATTSPFAITAYSDNENEAEKRAMQAVLLLLSPYLKTSRDLSAYLNSKGVKHNLHSEEVAPRQRYPVVRESKREMRLEVAASA